MHRGAPPKAQVPSPQPKRKTPLLCGVFLFAFRKQIRPRLLVPTQARYRGHGVPEKRRSIFLGRGGAAANVRRKRRARRGSKACSDEGTKRSWLTQSRLRRTIAIPFLTSPVTSTKKKNSAFMRGFSFCIQETDSPAALGPDTSALSRSRGPRKKAQHFFGERRSGGECAAEATRPPREQSLLRRRDQEVVADAIAPSANDCYSVPYKSRHLNQKEKLHFCAGFFILLQFAVFKLSARAVSARAEKNTNHSIRLCY